MILQFDLLYIAIMAIMFVALMIAHSYIWDSDPGFWTTAWAIFASFFWPLTSVIYGTVALGKLLLWSHGDLIGVYWR